MRAMVEKNEDLEKVVKEKIGSLSEQAMGTLMMLSATT
jgi:hypothetical protein